MTNPKAVYKFSEQEIRDTLSALALNGGNVARTSAESPVGMSRTSIRKYRDLAIENGRGAALSRADPIRARQPAELWAEAQVLAVEKITELLATGEVDLKSAAYSGQIASTAFLDHTVGRRGGVEVTIDQRSVVLPALQELSSADLRSLVSLAEVDGSE